MTKPECAKCAALPPEPYYADGCPDGTYRPRKPRPIVYGKTTPSHRCATHRRADVKAARLRAHDAYVCKTYGLSEGEYWELYEAQGRKCAFPRCRATGKVKRLAVDHDRDMAVNVCGHERDKGCRNCTRGLLCGPHNFDLMGKFAGDLEDAIAYRDNPPARKLRAA